MSMVINIPIEPIEHRYSADWNRWFEKELKDRKFDYWTILPNRLRDDKIREGAFLDVVNTTYFKAKQIAEIAGRFELGEIPRNERVVFLIHDGWFPIEQLAYMRDMLGCYEWKFVGLFHAGTYDRWDQLAQHGMYTYGEDLENAWFKIYDKVIVASNYHRNLLCLHRDINSERIEVIPWKVEVPEDLIGIEKPIAMNWIVFPHRYNVEKQPSLYGDTSIWISDEWSMVNTSGCKTKREYYEILAKSKICVSFSLQETFGIAMIEAVLLGCIPLVPDRLAYKEMYFDDFKYRGDEDFKKKLTKMCNAPDEYSLIKVNLQEAFKYNSSNFFDRLFAVLEDL